MNEEIIKQLLSRLDTTGKYVFEQQVNFIYAQAIGYIVIFTIMFVAFAGIVFYIEKTIPYGKEDIRIKATLKACIAFL